MTMRLIVTLLRASPWTNSSRVTPRSSSIRPKLARDRISVMRNPSSQPSANTARSGVTVLAEGQIQQAVRRSAEEQDDDRPGDLGNLAHRPCADEMDQAVHIESGEQDQHGHKRARRAHRHAEYFPTPAGRSLRSHWGILSFQPSQHG